MNNVLKCVARISNLAVIAGRCRTSCRCRQSEVQGFCAKLGSGCHASMCLWGTSTSVPLPLSAGLSVENCLHLHRAYAIFDRCRLNVTMDGLKFPERPGTVCTSDVLIGWTTRIMGCRADAAMAVAAQVQVGAAGGALELRQHCPPAAVGQDVYTLLKFYNLSTSLLNVIFMVRVKAMSVALSSLAMCCSRPAALAV